MVRHGTGNRRGPCNGGARPPHTMQKSAKIDLGELTRKENR